jgi:hypothetical protein
VALQRDTKDTRTGRKAAKGRDKPMRVTDDRYLRDRRAFDLAWRLIKLGARTGTISRWTGIAERRVRALQRSYRSLDPGDGGALKRPRGQSPYRIERLLHSPQQQQDAACLARICKSMGALPASHLVDVDRMLPGIERGELLCSAYESFQHQFPNSSLSIEQAVLLVSELVRGKEVTLAACVNCGNFAIVDRLNPESEICATCGRNIEPCVSCADKGGSLGEKSGDPCCKRDIGS